MSASGRRGGGTGVQIVVLVMMLAALVAVIAFKGRCARAMGGFFEQLDSETPRAPAPGAPK